MGHGVVSLVKLIQEDRCRTGTLARHAFGDDGQECPSYDINLDLLCTDLGPAEQRAMLAKLFTFSMVGIDAKPVDVEVDISPAAMPRTNLVGLAEAAVKESIHRIERAMANSGYQRPNDRIVINLSPADLPKEAASFDLPIALGLLAASGQFG